MPRCRRDFPLIRERRYERDAPVFPLIRERRFQWDADNTGSFAFPTSAGTTSLPVQDERLYFRCWGR